MSKVNVLNTVDKKSIIGEAGPIPREWEEARRRISSEAGHHAIIAGGAIRDHILGLPIKDIDVFVLGMSAQAAKDSFGAKIVEYAGIEEAKHCYQALGDGLPDLDLVFSQYNNVHDVLADFDLGICRVAWDGWDFVLTEDFVQDLYNRTVTVFDNFYRDHRDRIMAKLGPREFSMVKSKSDLDNLYRAAHRKGYRLMNRGNDTYWLMPHRPLTLVEVSERIY